MTEESRFAWTDPSQIRISDPSAPVKRKAGRPEGTTRGKHRYMTEDEMVRFMKAAKKAGSEEWLMMALAYYLGLRVSELVPASAGDYC
jgi:integrase